MTSKSLSLSEELLLRAFRNGGDQVSRELQEMALASDSEELRRAWIDVDSDPALLQRCAEQETERMVLRRLVQCIDFNGLITLVQRGYGSIVLNMLGRRSHFRKASRLDQDQKVAILEAVLAKHKGQSKHLFSPEVDKFRFDSNFRAIEILLKNTNTRGLSSLAIGAFKTGQLELLLKRLQGLDPLATSTHSLLLDMVLNLPRGTFPQGLEKLIQKLPNESQVSALKGAQPYDIQLIMRWWTSEDLGDDFGLKGSDFMKGYSFSNVGVRVAALAPAWLSVKEEEEVQGWSEEELNSHLDDFESTPVNASKTSTRVLHWMTIYSGAKEETSERILDHITKKDSKGYLGFSSSYFAETPNALEAYIEGNDIKGVLARRSDLSESWTSLIVEKAVEDFSYAYLLKAEKLLLSQDSERVLTECLEAAGWDVQLFNVIGKSFEGSFGELLETLRVLKEK